MIRNVQVRPQWLITIFIGSAAILLFAPSAAWAGSGRHDYDRDRTHAQVQSDSEYGHHSSHKRDHHSSHERDRYSSHERDRHFSHKRSHHVSHKRHHYVSHKRHRQHGKRRGYEKYHVGYYCGPCNHYFSARDELYDHVAHHHHVPYGHLSLAVSFGGFGWIFFG